MQIKNNAPQMNIAIITPYHKESIDQLIRCAKSVSSQTITAQHFMIADGYPQKEIENMGVRHISLDRAHGDYGDTPRSVGSAIAIGENFDAIGFLDADNWLDDTHLSDCIKSYRDSGFNADFVVARRRWVRADGSTIPYVAEEDINRSHVDTNCILLLPGAVHTATRWGLIPKETSAICDRIFFHSLLAEGLKPVFQDSVTVNYLCTWRSVFEYIGEKPPEYAKENIDLSKITKWWNRLGAKERQTISRRVGFEIFRGGHTSE